MMMPDPEQIGQMMAAQRQLGEHQMRLQIEARRRLLGWSAILCSCDPRYQPGVFAWAGCIIHGEFVILPDGTIL